ncbi:MAG TPA: HEAT repeat domain-containing protein [Candidatus Baltobacteraceae bacterium]|nr:HEAT repeat domain-containing protein [Candidatus Baltobacteraceae bacterium]
MPHSEFFFPGLLFLILGIVIIAVAYWPERWTIGWKPFVTAVWPVERLPLRENTTPQETDITAGVIVLPREITWPTLIDPAAGPLDEAERARVIEGLGIVGDPWSATVLAKAFDEEENELRVAAIEALGVSEGPIVAPTLERAYASYVIAERYAAIDGASRNANVPLLERALRDTDGTVALAAAYGLHRAKRDDLIESGLEGRTDARAAEIRRILPMLV